MTLLRRPLRLNIGFLIKSPIGTRRDFDYDYEQMRLSDPFDRALTAYLGRRSRR